MILILVSTFLYVSIVIFILTNAFPQNDSMKAEADELKDHSSNGYVICLLVKQNSYIYDFK